jgi:hypothetical protein
VVLSEREIMPGMTKMAELAIFIDAMRLLSIYSRFSCTRDISNESQAILHNAYGPHFNSKTEFGLIAWRYI